MRGGQGTYHRRPAIARQGWFDLLPGGHQIKGVNILPPYNSAAMFIDTFANWFSGAHAASFSNNTKSQIDNAQSKLGANTIRFAATQYGRAGSGSGYATPISDVDYFAAWDNLLDYVRSKGMYCIPVIGARDSNQIDGGSALYSYTPTLDWIVAESVLLSRFFVKHRDVIPYVDLANEAYNWGTATTSGQTQVNAAVVYQAVKAAAPQLKYAWSVTWLFQSLRMLPTGTWDIIDGHIYYDPVANDVDAILSSKNVPVSIGEYGKAVNAGSTARIATFNALAAVHANVTAGRRVAGSVQWSMRDYDTVSSNQWGMEDASGNLRTDTGPIVAAMAA